jgi:hypothetical protein
MGGARRGTGHDVVRAKCARGMQGERVLANPPVTRRMRGWMSPRCGVCNCPGIDLKDEQTAVLPTTVVRLGVRPGVRPGVHPDAALHD